MWTLPWSLLEAYISLPSYTAYPEINLEMESCMQKVCWIVSTGPTCVRKCGNSTEQMEKLPFRALAVVTLANPTIPLGALVLDFPSEWFHLEARSTGLETLDQPVTSLSPIPLRETSNLSIGSSPLQRTLQQGTWLWSCSQWRVLGRVGEGSALALRKDLGHVLWCNEL